MDRILSLAAMLGLLGACTATPADNRIARDSASPVAVNVVNTAGTSTGAAPPPSPRPPIKPSPWQPEAEVDPVPPPVEGDDPAR